MAVHNNKRPSDTTLDHDSKRLPNVSEIDLILKKERIDNEDFNVIVLHASPKQRFDFIIRQLSFYLSSDNLSIDHFYHSKFAEDSANTGIENVIDVKYILSAKRMTEIKATVDDIKQILSEKTIPNLSFHDCDGNFYIKLNDPLPKYIGKKPLIKKKKFGETPDTFHVAGPMVVITNIPSDVTDWGAVKQAINDTNKVKVRFISQISEGSCFAWLSKTSTFSDISDEKILVNDKPIKLELINNEAQYKKFISAMTLSTLNSRTKDLQRIKSSSMASPIQIDDFVVRNFGTIKIMLNSLLDELEIGTKIGLDSQAGKVLCFILDYHPNSKEKKGGDSRSLVGFEVGTSSNKEGKNKKCFCVITKGVKTEAVSAEDLSITKCLDGMKHFIHTFKKPESTDFVKSLSI